MGCYRSRSSPAWMETTSFELPFSRPPSSSTVSNVIHEATGTTPVGEFVAQQAAASFKTGLFCLFILKSTDHHKNMGNATNEKRVQPRSKNPELQVDVTLLHGAGAHTGRNDTCAQQADA